MPADAVTKADVVFRDATAHLYEDTLAPHFRVYETLHKNPWLDSLPGHGEALGVGCETSLVSFWSVIQWARRLPLPTQRALVAAPSRPWCVRAGNFVVVVGRKPAAAGST